MLTVEIQSEPNSFVVDAIITSDTEGINFYEKMQTDDFRIDISDKLFALVNAEIIKNDLTALEDPDLTDEQRLAINNDIADLETRMGTPIISIDKNNYATYINDDNDSLLQNGVQLQTIADNVLRIRFAPIQNFTHYGEDPISLTILFCVIGFDLDQPLGITDRKAFDVSLIPQLTTSIIEKSNPSTPDPILPDDAVRPDYPFNVVNGINENADNLYVNNGANTTSTLTPVYIVKTSAVSTEEITSLTDNDADFNWNTFESILINDKDNTFINLSYDVNGCNDVANITPAASTTAYIINDPNITLTTRNTLSGVKVYEIKQYIETTGTEEYLCDNVKVSVEV